MKKKDLVKNKKSAIYAKKIFCTDENNEEFISERKVRDHCHYTGKYRGAALSKCNLNYKTPKEIAVVFHNGSTYDYHFIMEQLAKEFKGKIDCLGENTEKYITFSVPIKKDLDNGKIITCKLKFIDSFRFMPASLSNLVNSLSEINIKECISCMERKAIISSCKYIRFKNNRLNYRCEKCSDKSCRSINGLIKNFPNIYKFCNKDLNKFILLLRKGVYPYECMDSWQDLMKNHYQIKNLFIAIYIQ